MAEIFDQVTGWDNEIPHNGGVSGGNLTCPSSTDCQFPTNNYPKASFDEASIPWPSPSGDNRIQAVGARITQTYSAGDGLGLEAAIQLGGATDKAGYVLQYHEDGGAKAQFNRNAAFISGTADLGTHPNDDPWLLILVYNNDSITSSAYEVPYDSFSLPAGHIAGYVSTDDGTSYTRVGSQAVVTGGGQPWDGTLALGVWAANDFLARAGNFVFTNLKAHAGSVPFTNDPPVLSNLSPASGGTGIPNTIISGDVTDPDDNLDASTLVLTVDGDIAYTGSAEQAGFSVTISSVANGIHYAILPDTPLAESTSITVEVYVEDDEGAPLDTSYAFTTTTDPAQIVAPTQEAKRPFEPILDLGLVRATLTSIGRYYIARGHTDGTAIQPYRFALGSGWENPRWGETLIPSPDSTDVVNSVYEGSLSGGDLSMDTANPKTLVMRIPGPVNPTTQISEVMVWAKILHSPVSGEKGTEIPFACAAFPSWFHATDQQFVLRLVVPV